MVLEAVSLFSVADAMLIAREELALRLPPCSSTPGGPAYSIIYPQNPILIIKALCYSTLIDPL